MIKVLRSLLFVPAASPLPAEAAIVVADALVIDLAGHSGEHAQPVEAVAALSRLRPVFVRVHGVAASRLGDDLAMVMPARPAGIILPDVAGPAQVEELGARLRVCEAECDRPDGETRIIPVLGAPAGILALAGRLWCARRIAAYAWEPPRLVGGLPAGRAADVTRLTRSLAILAAAHAGVPALDPLPDTDEAGDAFRDACRASRDEAIGGALVRNEAQAGIANAVFTA